MQPRHALQAAAKQFGFDGTDRSLADLLETVSKWQASERGQDPQTGNRTVENAAKARDAYEVAKLRLSAGVVMLVLAFAAPSLGQTPDTSRVADTSVTSGAGLIPAAADVREAIQELRANRQASEELAAQSRAWRDRWDFIDRHPDGGRLFDGARLVAIGQWIVKGLQAAWLIVVGAYQLGSLALYAVIAVCVARSIREVSDAVRVWRPKA